MRSLFTFALCGSLAISTPVYASRCKPASPPASAMYTSSLYTSTSEISSTYPDSTVSSSLENSVSPTTGSISESSPSGSLPTSVLTTNTNSYSNSYTEATTIESSSSFITSTSSIALSTSMSDTSSPSSSLSSSASSTPSSSSATSLATFQAVASGTGTAADGTYLRSNQRSGVVLGFGTQDSVAVATLSIDESGYLRNGDYYVIAQWQSLSRTGTTTNDPALVFTEAQLSDSSGYYGIICSSAGDVLSCYAEGRTSMNAFYVYEVSGYYRLFMATPSSSKLTASYLAVTINLQAA